MAKGITARADDYSQWYNDIVKKAGLEQNSAVRGCMVIKPHGFGIWEMMKGQLDHMFKETGHVNAAFPLLIPKSFLSKEAEHVDGFAKECAVVTHYRLKNDPDGNGVIVDPEAKLEEELIIRPTSETIIWDTYRDWVKSYRDLPLLINQWANVMRWEMRTRMFLRTSEFFSSQLSLLVSEIIQQQLKEDFFIEGIDVDIGFSQNTDFYNLDPQTTGLIPDVVDVNIRNRFKNNAFVLNLGGNYVRNNNTGQNNDYFLTDIVLEWYLTEDRRLKFNIYNRGDYNQIGDERRWKSGFGLRYRTEFGTLTDFKQELEEQVQDNSSF